LCASICEQSSAEEEREVDELDRVRC